MAPGLTAFRCLLIGLESHVSEKFWHGNVFEDSFFVTLSEMILSLPQLSSNPGATEPVRVIRSKNHLSKK